MTRNRLVLAIALLAGVAISCASGGGEPAPHDHDHETEHSDQAAAKPRYTTPPAGTQLSQVVVGMTDTQVRRVMGEPSGSNNYPSAKSWIPYYFGSDTHRSDWMYPGVGRVVFSRNRYSGELKVVKVLYNPDEP